MTSMGQLALELNHSVSQIPGLKNLSCFFCSKIGYKNKQRGIIGIFVLFLVGASVLLGYMIYFVSEF